MPRTTTRGGGARALTGAQFNKELTTMISELQGWQTTLRGQAKWIPQMQQMQTRMRELQRVAKAISAGRTAARAAYRGRGRRVTGAAGGIARAA